MRLARMGAFHQTRLSFMRTLLRRIRREAWRWDRPVWHIDGRGVGTAVYRIRSPHHCYSLVCFAHDLPPEKRTDRVIADAWDSTFTLFDGEPDAADLRRLAANVPLQEAGRCSQQELVLSRANKSVRLFEHVVDRLAAGEQPDATQIEAVGYLMRTTAVYGNGKFGVADRDRIAQRAEFTGPFQAELLTVWLIRAFTVDLVEHLARSRAARTAVPLDRVLRRALGVGNSTGLGMAPFLVSHPALLHAWVKARETALARVRALESALPGTVERFAAVFERTRQQIDEWRTDDRRQMQRIVELRDDLVRLSEQLTHRESRRRPWDALYRWAERALSVEGQELLVTLLLEPHADLVDDLARTMSVDEARSFRIDGTASAADTLAQIEDNYGWALRIDHDTRSANARFWYISEEKLEPRLGERYEEPGGELEQPLAIARDVRQLHAALRGVPPQTPLGEVLLAHPGHRFAARRVQICARYPYAEIRDNLVSAELMAIDMLRCKLAFFGATRFDPRSDRWVRITMYKGAPHPDELAQAGADDWAFAPASQPPA